MYFKYCYTHIFLIFNRHVKFLIILQGWGSNSMSYNVYKTFGGDTDPSLLHQRSRFSSLQSVRPLFIGDVWKVMTKETVKG